MGPLSDGKIKHSKAVAEFLFRNTRLTDRREEMYILGLLHDIGYMKQDKGHAVAGGEMLRDLGFKNWQPVAYHGDPNNTSNTMTDELNWADMLIDHEGNLVGYEARLAGIKARYGEKSTQYTDAQRIISKLRASGYPDVGARV